MSMNFLEAVVAHTQQMQMLVTLMKKPPLLKSDILAAIVPMISLMGVTAMILCQEASVTIP